MTTDTITSPYVSVDPEVTANRNARLQEARDILAGLEKQMKAIPHFASREYAKNKEQYKAQTAGLKSQMKEAQAIVDKWARIQVPEYLDPALALADLKRRAGEMYTGYAQEVKEFQVRFNRNPVDAIEWRGDDLAKAGGMEQMRLRLVKWVEQAATLGAFKAQVAEFVTKNERELLDNLRGSGGSSSPFSNAVEHYKAAGAVAFIADIPWRLSLYVEQYIEYEAKTASIREAHLAVLAQEAKAEVDPDAASAAGEVAADEQAADTEEATSNALGGQF